MLGRDNEQSLTGEPKPFGTVLLLEILLRSWTQFPIHVRYDRYATSTTDPCENGTKCRWFDALLPTTMRFCSSDTLHISGDMMPGKASLSTTYAAYISHDIDNNIHVQACSTRDRKKDYHCQARVCFPPRHDERRRKFHRPANFNH